MSDFNWDNLFAAFDSNESLALLLALIIAYILGIITGALLRGKKIRRLRKEFKEKDNAYQEIVLERDNYAKEIAVRDADLQKVRMERSNDHSRLRMLEEEKEQLSTDLNITLAKYRQLNQEVDERDLTISDLQQRIEKRPDSNVLIATRSDDQPRDSDENDGVQQMYAQTKSRLEALEHKINKLEQENTVLQEDLQKISQSRNSTPDSMGIYSPSVFSQPRNAEVVGGRINVDENIEKDDLTLINGVGPFLERQLNEAEIYTYRQISNWNRKDVDEITRKIGFFPGRIEQDNWVGQAARLQQMKLNNPTAFTKEEEHPNNPKDLKIIVGIGPKTESLLHSNDIRNWVELASTDVERLRAILRDAGVPFDTLNPSTWPEQARLASNGEWDRFEDYQGYLGVD